MIYLKTKKLAAEYKDLRNGMYSKYFKSRFVKGHKPSYAVGSEIDFIMLPKYLKTP